MSRAAIGWLSAVALAILVTGVFLAVAQPGGIGADDGDDELAQATSTTMADLPTTTSPTTLTPTTVPTGGPAGGPGGDGDGSGLGTGGAGTAEPGELVNSGHEALAVPGLLLAGAGLALARRRTA